MFTNKNTNINTYINPANSKTQSALAPLHSGLQIGYHI